MKNLLPYQSFIAALEGVQKTVNIAISRDDLEILHQSKYRLCFAQKMEGQDYNVVWQAYNDYFPNNQFSWTPQYQLFASNQFEAGKQVFVSTNTQAIALGQSCTLDKVGWLSDPNPEGADDAFTLNNEYGPIYPGVQQLSTGIDGLQINTPIYLTPNLIVKGVMELNPTEKVMVWFEQDMETSTLFTTPRDREIEVDMSSKSTISLLYEDGEWSILPTTTSPQNQSPSE